MSAAQFTPGPWEVGKNRFLQPVIRARNSYVVATAEVDFGGCERSSEKDDALRTREANARLIAAAPELYEALEVIAGCGAVDVSNTAIVVGNKANVVLQQAWAALAKARGELTEESGQ